MLSLCVYTVNGNATLCTVNSCYYRELTPLCQSYLIPYIAYGYTPDTLQALVCRNYISSPLREAVPATHVMRHTTV